MKNKIKLCFSLALLLFALNNAACINAKDTAIPINSSPSSTKVTEPSTLPTLPITTPVSPFQIDASCWNIKPLQLGESLKGSFIFEKMPNEFSAWDLSTFKTKPIVNQDLDRLIDSSDKSIMAGISKDNLILASPKQIRSFRLPDKNIVENLYFLTDGRIFFQKSPYYHEEDYKKGIGFTDIYYILDPVTGEITEHSVFLPKLEKNSHGFFAIGYSPNLKYVIYRSTPMRENVDDEYTLYDLETNKIMWTGPEYGSDISRGDGTMLPAWMPDSSALTYIFVDSKNRMYNYYSVSLDDKITKLTYFDNIIPYSWGSGWVTTANWSPNGRYLLFFAEPIDGGRYSKSLYIWDNQEKIAYKPCLPGEETAVFTQFTWAPDSSGVNVHFDHYIPNEGPKILLDSWNIILDLQNKTIFTLFTLPTLDSRGNLDTLFKDSRIAFDWINWEIP